MVDPKGDGWGFGDFLVVLLLIVVIVAIIKEVKSQ